MSKKQELIDEIADFMSAYVDIDEIKGIKCAQELADLIIDKIRTTHTRALCAHCECLGMNAANSWAVCINKTIPYFDDAYFRVMQKWGLIDEEGEPLV